MTVIFLLFSCISHNLIVTLPAKYISTNMTIKDFHKAAIITPEHEVSYAEMMQHIVEFAEKLQKFNNNSVANQQAVADKYAQRIIIFSENREEWIYAFFGIWKQGFIAVPVDATSTVSDLAYIINDCRPSAIWVSENTAEVAKEAIAQVGHTMELMTLGDIKNEGCAPAGGTDEMVFEGSKDKPCLIIYTSGTTGSPKGVMLSYDNLEANISGVADEVPIFSKERRTLVLLPVHHILPLMGCIIAPITRGGGVAICPTLSGPDIMNMLCKGEIAIMIGVPRLWQTLYYGIKKKIDASFITRALFNLCATVNNRSLSRFIFQSVHKKMGGHLDYCVSGGAALDTEIGNGLKTLGLEVLEGYGMTETAPIISFTRPGDYIPGCSGKPLPSVEVKIVDGELCARGRNLMLGYYNRPEETADVIDSDGFLHTGDLASLDEEGRVTITGRKKEIIVLSNGKNVQPNEIEFQLEKYDTYVKEAAVTEKDDALWAIIVPQRIDATEDFLKENVIQPYNKTVENYKKIMNIFIFNGDLPRTKLEKLQRFKLKDILENKGANVAPKKVVAPEFPDNPELQAIAQYIFEEKHIAINENSHIETDLAFDSLDKVGLQSFIEERFGITIDADEMAGFKNMAAIAEKCKQKKGEQHEEKNVGSVNWHDIMLSESSNLVLPTTSPTHYLYAKFFKKYLQFNNRLTIIGKENIPAHGPVILAPNHQSFIDGPLAISGLSKEQINEFYFYATEEHVQGSLRRNFAARHNIILMERKNLKNSILKMAEVLKQGKSLVIFPEGKRTHDGAMNNFRKTFAILSKELNVPILPVCIKGAFKAMPRGRIIPTPHHISIEYLPIIKPNAANSYEELAALVQSEINAKL